VSVCVRERGGEGIDLMSPREKLADRVSVWGRVRVVSTQLTVSAAAAADTAAAVSSVSSAFLCPPRPAVCLSVCPLSIDTVSLCPASAAAAGGLPSSSSSLTPRVRLCVCMCAIWLRTGGR